MFARERYAFIRRSLINLPKDVCVMKTDYILGVDVAKDTLSVCFMRRDNHQILKQTDILNDHQHIQSLLDDLSIENPRLISVAVEPTNTYWFDIAQSALGRGFDVVSAPPRATKMFLRSIAPRAKTDKIDAKGIALYAASVELKAYRPKPETLKTLDQMLGLRRKMSQSTAYFSHLAKEGFTTSDIAENMIAFSRQQLSELDRRINRSLKELETAKRLSDVPGFGPVVCAALVSRLLSIPFKRSDAFVAYVGLDLKVSDSGKSRGKRRLSHNGDAEMRRLLYLAAQASIRVVGSPFAAIYQRHLDRGLKSTQAICVVARKMARTAWSMVRFQTQYDPDRVLQERA